MRLKVKLHYRDKFTCSNLGSIRIVSLWMDIISVLEETVFTPSYCLVECSRRFGETCFLLSQNKDRGSRFLQNVNIFLPVYTISHSRRCLSLVKSAVRSTRVACVCVFLIMSVKVTLHMEDGREAFEAPVKVTELLLRRVSVHFRVLTQFFVFWCTTTHPLKIDLLYKPSFCHLMECDCRRGSDWYSDLLNIYRT
jgi:hypothetical protein